MTPKYKAVEEANKMAKKQMKLQREVFASKTEQALYDEMVKEADELRAELHAARAGIGGLQETVERLRNECDYLMAQMAGQRKAERERCARICDGKDDDLADAIRALEDEL